ncbi:NAD(P)H-hydrate dehydratase [Lacibacter luteus]|uniref:Bifunctional NAD(P)H-hydrate repair enzyme n=1 Tax=Lacibacter luteus TaxID=2508719 RepID=A0A4Q1CFZ8_9BACT|nr:NAD(P)H-hydrate dehydratase [Lacibacter luteus]RXK58944.1 NAD(P)H-hydrate dehydratase [Lacibacter luteus]
MKIFTAEQIRNWDWYTIANEPIASLQLMERVAAACSNWLLEQRYAQKPLHIFCGKGNNGGDGLAIARQLLTQDADVTVYILETGKKGTDDFQRNLELLHKYTSNIHFLQSADFFPILQLQDVVIDALLGTGLDRPLEGLIAELVQHISNSPATVISIDVPTGMFADKSCKDCICMRADHTLSFEVYKQCFLYAENAEYCGSIHLLHIGLHPAYYEATIAAHQIIESKTAQAICKKRNAAAHKGNFGHALLFAGSYGKTGAAVLSSKACLRSGVGLLTVHTAKCGYIPLQTAVPEAMVETDSNEQHLSAASADLLRYAAIGIGPGIGLHEETANVLMQLLQQAHQPIVLDADALNLLSIKKDLSALLHTDCILTPHPKEFERLFGKVANDFERIERAKEKAEELNCVIVLKSHHSFIACPDGNAWFNSTGNAGMATAGSGDVLTGILTGLLAQGYNTTEAAVLGVYLHGLAGDFAAAEQSQEAMIASDITAFLGKAFLHVSQTNV